ncbi:MAG: CARDB domain-containing protein [Methanofastidiosum sp.]
MKKVSVFLIGIFLMGVFTPGVYGNTDTVIYSGYLHDNDFVFVGPYAVSLIDYKDTIASFMVLEGTAPVGPLEMYISEGEALRVNEITINLIDVSNIGVNVIIKGPVGYKIGRSQYEFVIKEVKTNPLNVEPGEAFDLEILLSNEGSMKAYTVKGSINVPPIGTMVPFMPENTSDSTYIGDFEAGTEKLISFKLRANENMPAGNYPMAIVLVFYDGTNPYPRPYTIQFGLRVTGRTELMVVNFSSAPENIRPGNENVKIKVNLANQGTESAKYVKAYLDLKEPFTLSKSYESSYNLGNLLGGYAKDAEFLINVDKSAKKMTYTVPMIVEYRDSSNNLLREEFELNLDIKGKPELEITEYRLVPENVKAGGNVKIYLTIANNGEEKAESITVEAIERSEQPFDFTSKNDYIGVLEPGQKAEVVLATDVKSAAEEKTYQLNLRIRAVGDKEKQDLDVYLFQKNIDIPIEKSVSTIIIAVVIGLIVVLLIGGYYGYNNYIKKK